MSKQSDNNLDKNNQKKTPFFLYDGEQKLSWINQFVVTYLLGYAVGNPPSMVANVSAFKAVQKKPELNFLGLEERQYNEIVERQRNQYIILLLLGSIPFLVGLSLLVTYPLYRLDFFNSKTLNPFKQILINFINYNITLFFQISIQLIYLRLLFRIMEYLIPETLCIMQIINLNLELTRDDVIYRRDVKSMILFRMNYLARVTTLIPWHYGIGKPSNQKWMQQHFQNIAYYIRERRRWLITPTETTLEDIRRDFRELAYLYLTGLYGNWQWQSFELETEIIKQTRFQKIQGTLIRFVGIILPLLIMAFYILFPDKFPNADAEILKNLPYIFIAWLLVSLDITLKLGVIESLTKLITGLKDLSK
jgi:hypothetical protein